MTAAPITLLTPAERRVVAHLVHGPEPRAIAAETGPSRTPSPPASTGTGRELVGGRTLYGVNLARVDG